jgi:hypothetical protein
LATPEGLMAEAAQEKNVSTFLPHSSFVICICLPYRPFSNFPLSVRVVAPSAVVSEDMPPREETIPNTASLQRIARSQNPLETNYCKEIRSKCLL